MQIKKFEAKTMKEALKSIREEMGPDAIILSTKNSAQKGSVSGKSSIEVTAAIPVNNKSLEENKSEGSQAIVTYNKSKQVENQSVTIPSSVDVQENTAIKSNKTLSEKRYIDIQDEEKENKNKSTIKYNNTQLESTKTKELTTYSIPDNSKDELRKEFNELKRSMEKQIRFNQLHIEENLARYMHPLYVKLILNGVENNIANELLNSLSQEIMVKENVDREEKIKELFKQRMMNCIRILPSIESRVRDRKVPYFISFIGPSGSGKTSTMVKLASKLNIETDYKVGMISLDNQKVGIEEQIQSYSKILNIPACIAMNEKDLKAKLNEYRDMQVILIDTPGKNFQESSNLLEIKQRMQSCYPGETHLTISSHERDYDIYEIFNRYSVIPFDGIVFTKCDETQMHGSLFNVACRFRKPLAYIGVGQKIPEGIEQVSKEKIVNMILY